MTQIDKAVDDEIVRKYGKIRTDATPILYAILAELVEDRLCRKDYQKTIQEPQQQPELQLQAEIPPKLPKKPEKARQRR